MENTRPHGDEKSTPTAQGLLESNREVVEQAAALVAAIGRAGSDWRSFFRGQLERRPYLTLGWAAGFGYVLGTAVSPAAVRRVAAVGSRAALMAVVNEVVKSSLSSGVSTKARDSRGESARLSSEGRTD